MVLSATELKSLVENHRPEQNRPQSYLCSVVNAARGTVNGRLGPWPWALGRGDRAAPARPVVNTTAWAGEFEPHNDLSASSRGILVEPITNRKTKRAFSPFFLTKRLFCRNLKKPFPHFYIKNDVANSTAYGAWGRTWPRSGPSRLPWILLWQERGGGGRCGPQKPSAGVAGALRRMGLYFGIRLDRHAFPESYITVAEGGDAGPYGARGRAWRLSRPSRLSGVLLWQEGGWPGEMRPSETGRRGCRALKAHGAAHGTCRTVLWTVLMTVLHISMSICGNTWTNALHAAHFELLVSSV